jgi:hypothetical protein
LRAFLICRHIFPIDAWFIVHLCPSKIVHLFFTLWKLLRVCSWRIMNKQ